MTKADIVSQIQSKVGFSRQKTADVVDDLFEIMKKTLENGEAVKISGFGNFVVRHKKARRGRNPSTGETIIIQERKVLSFKPSQLLKKAINSVL